VFKGSTFVDNLSIEDFEVYEDGMLQRIEAVYLIKKKSIERMEEKKKFAPETSRCFYLFFQITDYSPKIKEALHYFIQNVLIPGDNLIVVTPLKTYRMKDEALDAKPREEIVNEIKDLLRKDAIAGSSEYRSTLDELTKIAGALTAALAPEDEMNPARKLDQFMGGEYEEMGGLEPEDKIELLSTMYTSVLEKLENMRIIDQYRLLEFAKFLKDKEGQKYVLLFYQREFLPQIDPAVMSQTVGKFQSLQHVMQKISDLFHLYKRDISIDVDMVKQAYADSSASIHFMYFTKPAEHIPGIRFEERSEDIYASFKEMARATGGTTESSSNPVSLFQRAVNSAENYYLLYYSPKNYEMDGKFREIKVRVKGKNYRVIHRAGYFAN